jgi:hypothetical protein
MKNAKYSHLVVLLIAGLLLLAGTQASRAQQLNKKAAELGENKPE